jgi:hypothetical protein
VFPGLLIPPAGTPVNNVVSPYPLGGLTPLTPYDFWVRDVACGTGLSTWVGPYTFTTTATPLPGQNCSFPITATFPAALPYTNTNTTCGMVDDYNTTTLLGYYDGGEDIIYELIVTSNVSIDITMDPLGTTWTGIGLFNGCPSLNSGIVANTGSSGIRTLTNVALTPGTYYLMIDTYPAPTCIPTFNLSIIASPVGVYCPAGPTSTFDSNVTLVNITGDSPTSINFVGCPGVVGVQNLTGTNSVTVTKNSPYTLNVTFGTCGGSYAGAGQVWIDWNQNFVFDAGESIGTSSGTPGIAPWNAPVAFPFTVPAGAISGPTRMRVMQWESGVLPLNPCGTFTWGSVMDFTVNVTP